MSENYGHISGAELPHLARTFSKLCCRSTDRLLTRDARSFHFSRASSGRRSQGRRTVRSPCLRTRTAFRRRHDYPKIGRLYEAIRSNLIHLHHRYGQGVFLVGPVAELHHVAKRRTVSARRYRNQANQAALLPSVSATSVGEMPKRKRRFQPSQSSRTGKI